LLGRAAGEDASILQAVRAPNTAPADQRRRRYVIDPLDILRADAAGRSQNLDIVGFYHSHPGHPAFPSQTDLDLSWPDYVYLIASIIPPQPVEFRAWRLTQAIPPMQEILLAPP